MLHADVCGFVAFGLALCTTEQILNSVRSFRDVGVSHLALDMAETDPDRVVAAMERFDRDVAAPFRADPGVAAG